MLTAVISLTAVGIVSAVGIALANKKYHVETDPRLAVLEKALPGVNCGTCGYSGCAVYAEALLGEDTPLNLCSPGGATTVSALASILGRDAVALERKVAFLLCGGGAGKARVPAEYHGVPDCRTAILVGGGPKACRYSCLGMGTCEKVCPFDAIRMAEEGLPEVDRVKCTACGKCISACPRRVLDLEPDRHRVTVRCSSPEPGGRVRTVCRVGCISCEICERVCPVDAVTITRNLARIEPDRCVECGLCASNCPTDSIHDGLLPRRKAVISDTCNGCGICALVCPYDAPAGKIKELFLIDPALCTGCALCVPRCPVKAISLEA